MIQGDMEYLIGQGQLRDIHMNISRDPIWDQGWDEWGRRHFVPGRRTRIRLDLELEVE
jgi:hypothetical protein